MKIKVTSFPFSFEYGPHHVTINTLDNDKLKVEVYPIDNPKELKTLILDGNSVDIEENLK